MKRIALLLLIFAFSAPVFAQSDEDGVRDAITDYLEGLYQAEPERIERSVSKDLVKFGHWRSSATQDYRGAPMNFEQLKGLAADWNLDNRQGLDENTPREIVILDVLDKIASAKLTAQWGIDYFQLEKLDGKWMIRHVVWQSHPMGD